MGRIVMSPLNVMERRQFHARVGWVRGGKNSRSMCRRRKAYLSGILQILHNKRRKEEIRKSELEVRR